MLSVLKRRETCLGRDVCRSGYLNYYINSIAISQNRRVICEHGVPGGDRLCRFSRRRRTMPSGNSCLGKSLFAVFQSSVRDSNEANSGNRRSKLQRDSAALCSCANHADANRLSVGLSYKKNSIDHILNDDMVAFFGPFKQNEHREKQEQRQKEKHKTPVAMKTARQEAWIDIEAKQRQRYDSNSILDYGQWKHQ